MSLTRPAGEDVTLLCVVRDGTFTSWFRDKPETEQLDTGHVKPELRKSLISADKRHLPELLIRGVTVNDSGVYWCVGGRSTVRYNLRVLGKSCIMHVVYI